LAAETVEIVTVAGPLEPARLGWVADLYANADPKFRRRDVLQHLFVDSPAGPGLHAFALDRGRPVGHCAVVPLRTRLGSGELRSGKLEALWVEADYRGRQAGGATLVRGLLDRLYGLADEGGFVLVHGIATERIGGVIRYVPLGRVGEPSLVAAFRSSAVAAGRETLAAGGLVAAQRTLRGLARVVVRRLDEAVVRAAGAADIDLAEAPPPPEGRWTILAADAWDWYRASPLVRVLELAGRHGCRALVQLPGVPGQALRLIGWRAERDGIVPALSLLAAAGRLAQTSGAATLRFQPWASPAGDGRLRRACRLLGLVPRHDLTMLWVRTSDPTFENPQAVIPTPLLYLGF
jgi:hypothetical protein